MRLAALLHWKKPEMPHAFGAALVLLAAEVDGFCRQARCAYQLPQVWRLSLLAPFSPIAFHDASTTPFPVIITPLASSAATTDCNVFASPVTGEVPDFSRATRVVMRIPAAFARVC
jgi:hypothetical protein